MNFEWDGKKAERNLKKHGVSFQDAATVFNDPLAITFDDPYHSTDECRFLTFGMIRNKKLVIVSHTERSGFTRIIGSREMTKTERKIYEET